MLRSRLFCYDLNGFKTGNCLMLNAVAPFIGNVQLSNIMLRNQQVCLYKTSFCINYHINKKNNNFIMRVGGFSL